MAEEYEHKYEGYYWKREKAKEKTIEGFLKFENGEILVEGTRDETPLQEHSEKTKLKNELQHLGSGTEVKIKIEAWEWEEIEETTDFDPFDHMKDQ